MVLQNAIINEEMRNVNTVDSETSFHIEKTSLFQYIFKRLFFFGADFIIKGFVEQKKNIFFWWGKKCIILYVTPF